MMTELVTEHEIIAVYKALLHREPESRAVIDHHKSNNYTLEGFLEFILNSPEYMAVERSAPAKSTEPVTAFVRHNGSNYTIPSDLQSCQTDLKRVLLVGQCLVGGWPQVLHQHGIRAHIDFLLVSPSAPIVAPRPLEEYSFQIVQIPLRQILLDRDYAEWLRSPFGDDAATERLFSLICGKLDFWLEQVLVWSTIIPTFVPNFMRPQANVNGRLFHGSDISSNIHLAERVNRHLAARIAHRNNVHVLDLDHVAGVFGRRFVQDDSVWAFPHGGLINDFDFELDQDRIVAAPPLSAHYRHETGEFIRAVWLEAEAMYRSICQMDAVKMVCVDLDDTLWRGVLADTEDIEHWRAVEGWPLGIAEALLALRRRGIVLALISKNNLDRIRDIWSKVFTREIALDDFAIIKVNWNDKAQSIGEAMREANLLPRSVVFLDDNPVERANVAQAFPDIRVIDAPHYYWKRILMWSAETQSSFISEESSRRSEMVRSQVEREVERRTMSRDEFIAGLQLKGMFSTVAGPEDRRFARTLELLNKTNQFNTTGRRWTAHELGGMCRDGSVLVCEASDRHAVYGLVLIGVASETTIEQIVMSCRVIGLDLEVAMVALLTETILRRRPIALARLEDTDANFLSRDLFGKCGWREADGLWRTGHAVAWPPHVDVTRQDEAPAPTSAGS